MFNWVKNIFGPAKAQYSMPFDGTLVSDLDKMVAEPVPFKWRGEIHFLKPITTKEFMQVSEGMAYLDKCMKEGKFNPHDLVKGYARVFSSMCDTIGLKEVEDMTQAQIGALYNLVLETVTGKIHAEKKTLKMAAVS